MYLAVLPLNIHPTPGIGETHRRSLRLCPCDELEAARRQSAAGHSPDGDKLR